MKISEIYQSVQGEGRLTGVESVFVRVSGCNLRCWFCDTPYASWKPEGENFSVEEVFEQISSFSSKNVVLTGGEPLIFRELVELTHRLKQEGYHITVETAGSAFQPVECDLMSISPKLANSRPSKELAGDWAIRHDRERHQPEVIKKLVNGYDCQFKFVVDSPEDLEDVSRYLEEFPAIEEERIWLMPQGTEQIELTKKEAWLEPLCQERNWKLCSRKHIEWFGFQRGV